MERRGLFEPGDQVKTFKGECGLVILRAKLESMIDIIRQGWRPGHFFAQGCCENIDYLTQVTVFFEDGTYDIMRSMNIKKATQGRGIRGPDYKPCYGISNPKITGFRVSLSSGVPSLQKSIGTYNLFE